MGQGQFICAPESGHIRGETMSTLAVKTSAWRDIRVKLAPYAAIPLRLIVGYGFMAHGLAQLRRGPEAFADILHAIGVPSPQLMAWLTIATEILSGIAILVGHRGSRADNFAWARFQVKNHHRDNHREDTIRECCQPLGWCRSVSHAPHSLRLVITFRSEDA